MSGSSSSSSSPGSGGGSGSEGSRHVAASIAPGAAAAPHDNAETHTAPGIDPRYGAVAPPAPSAPGIPAYQDPSSARTGDAPLGAAPGAGAYPNPYILPGNAGPVSAGMPAPGAYPIPSSRRRVRPRDIVIPAVSAVVVMAGVATGVVVAANHSSTDQAAPPTAHTTSGPRQAPSGSASVRGLAGAGPTAAGTQPTLTDPAQVVLQYFNDINVGDYQAAWQLGGKNFGQSYTQFVAGFNGTRNDAATAHDTSPTTAAVQMTATQTDGVQHTYSGTFTVVNGEITARTFQQTG